MCTSLSFAAQGLKSDQEAFVAALDQAHARSYHSYFTQYVGGVTRGLEIRLEFGL